MISKKPVYHTALCVIPPVELWTPINAIRKTSDKAYNRWMPHVNLLFPFIAPQDFEQGVVQLRNALSSVQPFLVHLSQFKAFEHKNAILWLDPQPEVSSVGTKDPMLELQAKVLSVFPWCDEINRKSASGFHAHLTVGQAQKQKTNATLKKLQDTWQPSSFLVKEVFLITRDGASEDQPMYVVKSVPLGQTVSPLPFPSLAVTNFTFLAPIQDVHLAELSSLISKQVPYLQHTLVVQETASPNHGEQLGAWVTKNANMHHEAKPGTLCFVVCHDVNKKIIGMTNLKNIQWDSKSAELDVWISEHMQHKGLATMCTRRIIEVAKSQLGISKFTMLCPSERAVKLAERVGMQQVPNSNLYSFK